MARRRRTCTARAMRAKSITTAETIILATRAHSGALQLFREFWWNEIHDAIHSQDKQERNRQENEQSEDGSEGEDECATGTPTPTASTLLSTHTEVIAALPADVIDSLNTAFADSLSYQNRKAARSLGRSTFWGWDVLAVFAIFGLEACTRRFLDGVKALSDVWDTRDTAWAALLEASTQRREAARTGSRAQTAEWLTEDATLANKRGTAKPRPRSTSADSEDTDNNGNDEGDENLQQNGGEKNKDGEDAGEDGNDEGEGNLQQDAGDKSKDNEGTGKDGNDEAEENLQQDEGDESEEIEVGRREKHKENDNDNNEGDITFDSPCDDDTSFMSIDDVNGGPMGDVNDGGGDDAAFRFSFGDFPAAEIPRNQPALDNNNKTDSTQQRHRNNVQGYTQSSSMDMSKRPAADTETGGTETARQQRRRIEPPMFVDVPGLDVTRSHVDHGVPLDRWLALFRETTTTLRLPVEESFWENVTTPARYCILVPASGDNGAQPETARLAAVALVTLDRDAQNHTRSHVRAFVPAQAETLDTDELLCGVKDFARRASTRAGSGSMNKRVEHEEEDSVTMDSSFPIITPEAHPSALVAIATFYCAGHTPRELTAACLDPTLWALMLRAAERECPAAPIQLVSARAFCQTTSQSFVAPTSCRRETDYLANMEKENARLRHVRSMLSLVVSRIGTLHDTCVAILWCLTRYLETSREPRAYAGSDEVSEDDLGADIATAEQMIGHLQQRILDDQARSDQKSARASRRALEAQQRSLSHAQQQLELKFTNVMFEGVVSLCVFSQLSRNHLKVAMMRDGRGEEGVGGKRASGSVCGITHNLKQDVTPADASDTGRPTCKPQAARPSDGTTRYADLERKRSQGTSAVTAHVAAANITSHVKKVARRSTQATTAYRTLDADLAVSKCQTEMTLSQDSAFTNLPTAYKCKPLQSTQPWAMRDPFSWPYSQHRQQNFRPDSVGFVDPHLPMDQYGPGPQINWKASLGFRHRRMEESDCTSVLAWTPPKHCERFGIDVSMGRDVTEYVHTAWRKKHKDRGAVEPGEPIDAWDRIHPDIRNDVTRLSQETTMGQFIANMQEKYFTWRQIFMRDPRYGPQQYAVGYSHSAVGNQQQGSPSAPAAEGTPPGQPKETIAQRDHFPNFYVGRQLQPREKLTPSRDDAGDMLLDPRCICRMDSTARARECRHISEVGSGARQDQIHLVQVKVGKLLSRKVNTPARTDTRKHRHPQEGISFIHIEMRTRNRNGVGSDSAESFDSKVDFAIHVLATGGEMSSSAIGAPTSVHSSQPIDTGQSMHWPQYSLQIIPGSVQVDPVQPEYNIETTTCSRQCAHWILNAET
ncbi:uncharacterized protein MYCFIDRAFT_84776 [Pseudocercospora fijiensis CIRAD86]|uniref:Uncharacterized protein n=1 Tax=Pseudocercospora fijiensis (strain CIRAD86) TaxID=383855 RepID=M2ZCG6_PSEFD|nr:uncharacterized protein MYCFIDRAFT_84776 [Pseudocercospora fijiensis CIRAD86]EME76784.1 hypothetical protein MYCFIDRAFT_84776 [Pseudocercospora fijiensis CIRAD86]